MQEAVATRARDGEGARTWVCRAVHCQSTAVAQPGSATRHDLRHCDVHRRGCLGSALKDRGNHVEKMNHWLFPALREIDSSARHDALRKANDTFFDAVEPMGLAVALLVTLSLTRYCAAGWRSGRALWCLVGELRGRDPGVGRPCGTFLRQAHAPRLANLPFTAFGPSRNIMRWRVQRRSVPTRVIGAVPARHPIQKSKTMESPP